MISDLKWSLFASIGRYILQTSAIIFLARLIEPESFGIFSATLALTTVVFFLCQAGTVNLIVTCKKENLKSIFIQTTLLSVFLGFLFFFILILACEFILELIGLAAENKWVLFLLSLNIVVKILYTPLEALFIREKKFKGIAYIELLTFGIGYFLTALIAGFYGFEEYALVFAVLFQSVLSLLIYAYFAYRKYEFSQLQIRLNTAGFSKVLKRSFLFSYFQVMSSFSGQVDNIFVSKYIGVEALGFYSRAYQLMVVPCNFFGLVVGRVFLINFKNILEIKKELVIKRVFYSLFFVTVSSSFVTSLIYYFGKDIISILLGDKWVDIYMSLLILSLSMYPRLVYKINEPILLSNGKEKLASFATTFYVCLLTILLFLFGEDGLDSICFVIVFTTYIYSMISSVIVCSLVKSVAPIYFIFFIFNLGFFWIFI